MVERLTCNEDVAGSIPAGGFAGRFQSGQMGQTVNLLANAFGGSNPSLPTGILIVLLAGVSPVFF